MTVLAAIVVVACSPASSAACSGVGGGIIMVPMLTLAFGVPIKTAIATSIVCVIATSSMAQTVVRAPGHDQRPGSACCSRWRPASAPSRVASPPCSSTAACCRSPSPSCCVYVAWQMNRRGGDVAPGRPASLEASYHDPAGGPRTSSYGVGAPRLGFALCLARRQRLGPARGGRRGLQGADHEPAHGRAAQGDDRHQQPHDRRHRGDRRGHLLRPRLPGPVLRGAGGARHPRRGAASGRASPCGLNARTLAVVFQIVLVVFAVLMALKAVGVGV